jgi:hypothetical protein
MVLSPIQDAYAEPGQDSRNIAGIEVVIVVEDVQDQRKWNNTQLKGKLQN